MYFMHSCGADVCLFVKTQNAIYIEIYVPSCINEQFVILTYVSLRVSLGKQ